MSEWQLQTPVAVMIFNRPHTTRRVFEVLQQVKPPKLLVVADGPRSNKAGEREQCAATRAIFEHIDWPCELLTNYAEHNLGCGGRLSSGLSWVFAQVPEAIILEDDCLPHPTFFRFCAELLERYRDDERVMHISGSNFLVGAEPCSGSYYFSRYPQVWGWASWRRAWRHYDFLLSDWPVVAKQGWLQGMLEDESARRFWAELFEQIYQTGQGAGPHTWDYQWDFACWMQHGLSITPRINLISNIGFGAEATHTLAPDAFVAQLLRRFGFAPDSAWGKSLQALAGRLAANRFANLPLEAMTFPLQHPRFFVRDVQADERIQRRNYQGGLFTAFKRQIKKRLLPHGGNA
jgi:hypothetical protein